MYRKYKKIRLENCFVNLDEYCTGCTMVQQNSTCTMYKVYILKHCTLYRMYHVLHEYKVGIQTKTLFRKDLIDLNS